MSDIRDGEVAVDAPAPRDAGLVYIGRIRTPWTSRDDAPKQGRHDGPVCRVEIFEPWVAALQGIEAFEQLDIVYWLHLSRRDLVVQNPKRDGRLMGTFALRSPVRPNPIGIYSVRLVEVNGGTLFVRGLDCLDETPLIDVKPNHCIYAPVGA